MKRQGITTDCANPSPIVEAFVMEDLYMTKERLDKIEEQIVLEQRTVDYDTKDYTIEFINQKYLKDIDKEKNEIFVPEY